MKVAGNRKAKVFPGLYPTRVYFRVEMQQGPTVEYLGKPSRNAYQQLRRALPRRKRNGGTYFISEFDREGILYLCSLDRSGRVANKTSPAWVPIHPGNYYDSSMSWMAGAANKSMKRNGIYGTGEVF